MKATQTPNGRPSAPTGRKPAGPKVVTGGERPQGTKITGNLGCATLYPGAGKLVQKTSEPIYCGTMSGVVYGFVKHPNSKDQNRESTRFSGNFALVTHLGRLIEGHECYLPGSIARPIEAALKLRGNDGGSPIPLSIEVWCEPDEAGRPASPLGYSYVCYDRQKKKANDPVLELMYESGILERPEAAPAQIEGPATPDEGTYDPETVEVLTGQQA
jgi:hypothetical protein